MVYLAIFVSAAQLGLEMDAPQYQDVYDVVGNVCLVIFCIELVVKLVVLRGEFFYSGWNIFDFFLVTLSLVDSFSGGQVGPVVVLRMFRMAKIARVLRFLKVFKELWLLVSGILSALKLLFWVLFLLCMMLYMAALFCCMMLAKQEYDERYDSWP